MIPSLVPMDYEIADTLGIAVPKGVTVRGFEPPPVPLGALVPAIKPDYVFRQETLRPLVYVINREWNRNQWQDRFALHLYGPPGCGKTSVPEQVFARTHTPMATFTATHETIVADLFEVQTLIDGTKSTQPGPALLAMLHGYPLVLNEFDYLRPGTAATLLDVFDRGRYVTAEGELVIAARGFIPIVTSNTHGGGDLTGGFAGTKVQNRALMRRMLKVEVDYPAETLELDILQRRFPHAEASDLRNFIRVATSIRTSYRAGIDPSPSPAAGGLARIEDTIGTEALCEWFAATCVFGYLSQQGQNPEVYAMNLVFGNGLEPASRIAVVAMVQAIFPDQTATERSARRLQRYARADRKAA